MRQQLMLLAPIALAAQHGSSGVQLQPICHHLGVENNPAMAGSTQLPTNSNFRKHYRSKIPLLHAALPPRLPPTLIFGTDARSRRASTTDEPNRKLIATLHPKR